MTSGRIIADYDNIEQFLQNVFHILLQRDGKQNRIMLFGSSNSKKTMH